ncbi:hypothetical protein GGR52DRAFT_340136 [Hypoxylon sp. FL1284]|nr:hypothetical protein GGR52DRAFT_340136 [Hypoxylon sp. FL1284]
MISTHNTSLANRTARATRELWLHWQYAVSDCDGPHYVLQSGSILVTQRPPPLAHTCQQSRRVALRKGRMFRLGNGKGTWFRPETDVFLWGGSKVGLGELASHVRNIVLQRSTATDYYQACDTFAWLLDHANFTSLENVYVEMASNFTLVNQTWYPAVDKRLFKNNTVVIPDLSFAEDELSKKIDSLSQMLPYHVATYWREYRSIGFTQVNDWIDHIAGDVTFAWISTQARRIEEISEDQVEAVEDETLKHPSGITWWAYLANNAPAFSPTCVFAQLRL